MKRIRSSPRNRSPRAAQNINLPHDLAREIRNSSTLSTPHFHSVGSARLLRTKDRKVHARRNPTIKIYPVSMQTHRCAQISRDSVYVQTGGGGRERGRESWLALLTVLFLRVRPSTDLGRITAEIAIRKIRLYRGSVSICRTTPLAAAFRQLHVYVCTEGRAIDPLF